MVFDAVVDGEFGAGVLGRGGGEFGGEGGEGSAAPGGGGGVEADVQGGADDLQVPGQGECFAEQCAAFVLAAGVAKASAERFSDEGRREIRAPLIRYVNRYTGEEFELEEVDLTLVLEAETTLLDNPFKANRTIVRVTLKALEKYGSYARANEWLGVAHLFPHSADNLAGFFSGYLALEPWYSTTYVDWFVRVPESHWGALDWVAAHAARPLANVFLLEGAARVLRTWLESGQTVPKVSIAASILAMRAPEYCRTVVWERASTTMDPLLLRTFALALATAGADRGRVRSVASQDERNFLLVRYLQSRDWRLSTR